jgi:hypothetical protein
VKDSDQARSNKINLSNHQLEQLRQGRIIEDKNVIDAYIFLLRKRARLENYEKHILYFTTELYHLVKEIINNHPEYEELAIKKILRSVGNIPKYNKVLIPIYAPD